MYQTLLQKLQKIHQFVQTELEAVENHSTSEESASKPTSAAQISPAPSPQVGTAQSRTTQSGTAQSRAAQFLPVFAEVKQTWSEMQAQPPSHPRWQALSTEIHKQLRLAEVDVQFWAAARQSETATQRGQQLRDRLVTLMNYCETGIKLSQQNSGSEDGNVLP